MATYIDEPSHTFNEYLLIPGYSSAEAIPAKYVADRLTQELGWNKNTTYTLIKRCMKKGAIERTEPNFMCHALIAKEDVQETETNELINKIYDGSVDKLFAALLGRKKLSTEQIEKLKQIVDSLE